MNFINVHDSWLVSCRISFKIIETTIHPLDNYKYFSDKICVLYLEYVFTIKSSCIWISDIWDSTSFRHLEILCIHENQRLVSLDITILVIRVNQSRKDYYRSFFSYMNVDSIFSHNTSTCLSIVTKTRVVLSSTYSIQHDPIPFCTVRSHSDLYTVSSELRRHAECSNWIWYVKMYTDCSMSSLQSTSKIFFLYPSCGNWIIFFFDTWSKTWGIRDMMCHTD